MANGPTKLSLFLDISNLNCFTIPEMDVNDFEPQTNTEVDKISERASQLVCCFFICATIPLSPTFFWHSQVTS